MRKLYGKLAVTNIRNNWQFYLPYLLTGMLTAAMFYTMSAMLYNQGLEKMPGSASLLSIMGFGTIILRIFIFIFLFYTNSFIIKRRKKELGIYNILGMEKRHLVGVLTLETAAIALLAVGGGLIAGIAFNKLLTMLLYRLVGFESPIQFYVSVNGIMDTAVLFAVIYAAALLYNCLQIRLSKPVELLSSGSVGEREPRTKILLTLAGIGCLGVGYYISITTENPLMAITLFFLAVLLVILGTYALFTAGSIALLKILRRNKNYYYQARHFTAVSGLIYRMKQNAVALANICILSTMVIVMVSTSVCMYVGVEDELVNRYPAEITLKGEHREGADTSKLLETVRERIEREGRNMVSEREYGYLTLTAMKQEDVFRTDPKVIEENEYSDWHRLIVISRENYEKMTEESLEPQKEGTVLIAGVPEYNQDEVELFGKRYPVEKVSMSTDGEEQYLSNMMSGFYYLIFPGAETVKELYNSQKAYDLTPGETLYSWDAYMDIDGTDEEKLACAASVRDVLAELTPKEEQEESEWLWMRMESRVENRDMFYANNGGFLFLGLFLGIMFLVVTVLIIYYKQISEGYDDRERFAIMTKVGMGSQEIKATIYSQVRLVFFLPIVTAAIHAAAAFPMIRRLLTLMNLTNAALFALCVIVTILVFAVIYLLVFLMTSRTYYRIVHG